MQQQVRKQERWEYQTQCTWVLQKLTDIISATQTCCNKSKILYIVSVKKQTYFCTKITTRKKSLLDLHSNKYSLSPQTLLWLRRVAMVTETVWMYQDKHMLSHSIICLKQHPGKKRKKEEKNPPQLAGSGKIYTTHFFFSSFLCVHTIQSFRIHKTDSKHYMHDNIHTGHKNCTQVIFLIF